MDLSTLSPHLIKIASIANSIIKHRYNLQNAIVSTALNSTIPFTPSLHWKTPKEFIICEVADRPLPIAVKLQYADIAATDFPVRIIVAFPHDNGLSSAEFSKEVKTLKALGIGYITVNEISNTKIEYQGVCVNQKLDKIDFKKFPKNISQFVQEAYECYMDDGKPDVGLQKLGQLSESLIYNAAVDAKKKGKFIYASFKPPEFINHRFLLKKMKEEAVLGIGILERCDVFAMARNTVSHSPKNISSGITISKGIKNNFILGVPLIEDIIKEIKSKGLIVKP